MSMITIRFDYESRRYRRGFVPIYLSLHDEHGREIPRTWFNAVARIAGYTNLPPTLRLRPASGNRTEPPFQAH